MYQGPRVYIVGRRIHHGLVGLVMVLVGFACIWDDRRDFPWRWTEYR